MTMEPAGPTAKVNEVLLVALPSEVTTVMGPDVAPEGTVTVICVSEFTVKSAAVPLKLTLVTPAKLVPVSVTVSFAAPADGEKEVMDGVPFPVSTPKLRLLLAAPLGVVTLMVPLVADAGTVAVIWVSESTVNDAALTPLKATAVALEKYVPVITTPDAGAP
jgi:hypothetical protein